MAQSIGVKVVGIETLVEQHLEGLNAMIPRDDTSAPPSLYTHIMKSFQTNKDARESGGVNKILLDCLRAYNGQYDPEDWAKIAEEGGSTIFMNLTSTKVRAAISWIKDILLAGKEDAFSITPTPLVELPDDVHEGIKQRVSQDFEKMLNPPAPPQDPNAPPAPQQKKPDVLETLKEINEYKRDLYEAVQEELNKEAQFGFKVIETKIKDQMKEGKWEKALSEFIDDFCIFPTAFLKGPIVTRKKRLMWVNGMAEAVEDYCLMNKRISPLDIYPAPEASSVQDGDLCEHLRLSRRELSSLRRATDAGYKPEAIARVLENNDGMGLSNALDTNIEQEKADEELREDINGANENVYHGIHFFGSVPCGLLKEWGMEDPVLDQVDPLDTVEVEAIIIGSEIIRCVLNDDPLGRRPYYSASYQKRPGSVWGISPPQMMKDIQKMCNACARALSNNMGLSSGPLAEVNIERLADGQDLSELRPRDIIQTTSDPTGAAGKAVNFFTIPSVAGELLAVYKEFELRADDVTMIPRYSYGNERTGGAAQTASGLSMLLESASKGIKDAIRHIDEGVIIPRVEMEFYTTMLRGELDFTGDINVIAHGSSTLTLKGAEQMRRNEFLQVTANPIDQELMGPIGRASILRLVAKDLNLGETVVPNRQEIKSLMKRKAESQQQPPPQVQAAQVQNETIYQISKERLQLDAAEVQRKQAKDEADIALRAREQEVRERTESTKAIASLEKVKMQESAEDNRNAQNIALKLETSDVQGEGIGG